MQKLDSRLLDSFDPPAQSVAARGIELAALQDATGKRFRLDCADNGTAASLAKALSEAEPGPTNDGLRENICRAVVNMTHECPDAANSFTAAGGVEAIVSSVFETSRHEGTLRTACIAAASLAAYSQAGKEACVSAGVVAAIVRQLLEPRAYDPETECYAILALGNIASCEEGELACVSCDAPSAIVEVMKTTAHCGAMNYGCVALQNIAWLRGRWLASLASVFDLFIRIDAHCSPLFVSEQPTTSAFVVRPVPSLPCGAY